MAKCDCQGFQGDYSKNLEHSQNSDFFLFFFCEAIQLIPHGIGSVSRLLYGLMITRKSWTRQWFSSNVERWTKILKVYNEKIDS